MTTAYRPMPSAEYLHQIFTYDEDTGKLYWKHRNDVPAWINTRFAGKLVGSFDRGYLTVRLNNKLFFVHRIVFVMHYGDVLGPDDQLDHADLDRANNKIDNLRIATQSQNNTNRNKQSNSTAELKCIDQLPSGGYRVRVAGRHIGCYVSLETAAAAYNKAAYKIFGEFGRLI